MMYLLENKKQLKVFLPKNSGWYISNNGGNIKIEVKSGGKKETKTLPYAWNEQEMAVAIEEIKQIYKRYIEGSVHTLAAATSIASVEMRSAPWTVFQEVGDQLPKGREATILQPGFVLIWSRTSACQAGWRVSENAK